MDSGLTMRVHTHQFDHVDCWRYYLENTALEEAQEPIEGTKCHRI